MQQVQESSSRPSRSISTIAKVTAGIILGGVIVFILLGVAGVTAIKKLFDPFQQKTSITESTVVRSIQELKRLQTVVYKLDQVVTEERTNILPPALSGDRILLIVHGDVTAGIDLGKLSEEDVRISGRNIRVKLPPAEIFATRTDTQRTRVYSRDTGIFTTPDPQMESQVRRRAEGQLTAAALREGILAQADQNARNTITSILHSLNFEKVEIE